MHLSRRRFLGNSSLMLAAAGMGASDAFADEAADKMGHDLVETSADMALYSATPRGRLSDGYYALNNTFGRGDLKNGRDFTCKITCSPKTFPNNTVFEWRWPEKGGKDVGSFAYGWPLINYGDSYYGNPFDASGPWPTKLKDLKSLVVHYDISLTGNLNSYDVLLDMFVTETPTSSDGSFVAEISYFAQSNDLPLLGNPHQFSFGQAHVGAQGRQICVFPSNAQLHRNLLQASIDLKEVIDYLVAQKFLSGEEYLRGAQFGVEMQVPAPYNSAPYAGTMTLNRLSYDWA
jgi:hypothetical protein